MDAVRDMFRLLDGVKHGLCLVPINKASYRLPRTAL